MTEEQQFIEQLRSGDRIAFTQMVTTHQKQIYFLARDLTGNHHDAEDLAQEVFIKAYRSIQNFRGEAKLNTWLYKIAINTFLDKRKRKSHNMLVFKEDLSKESNNPTHPGQQAQPGNPEKTAEGRLIQEHIEHALQNLSPRERAVFVMRHYHDQAIKEIARGLDIAEGTVKSLLYRAIQKLQQKLAFYRQDLGLEEEK
ncbi:MAG: RNA polymerase sigma factor [Calditrichia bacterium]|jgi:RNA polymerase sigma-70 factor (ECF subfamily)